MIDVTCTAVPPPVKIIRFIVTSQILAFTFVVVILYNKCTIIDVRSENMTDLCTYILYVTGKIGQEKEKSSLIFEREREQEKHERKQRSIRSDDPG